MKNNSFRASVLKRLIISFICILTPLYALGIYIYNNSMMTLRHEITNSMTSQISFYLEGMENEVLRIRTLQYELINDRNINRMASIPQAMSNIEKWESLLRIQDRLFAIKNSSSYIESVSIMFPAAQKTVSAETVSEFSLADFEKVKALPDASEENILNIDGSLYLNLPYPQWYMTNRDPTFVIVIKLSQKAFEEALDTMRNNPDEEVVLFNTMNELTIATEYNKNFHAEILELIQNADPEAVESTKTILIDGVRCIIAYRTSDYLQSVMYKFVPEESVFKYIKVYNIWFAVFTALALVIIAVYSAYIHQFIHLPLSRLANSFKEVKKGNFKIHIEHRHDDEFRFIYQHFNSMVEDLGILIDQSYKQKMLIQKAEMKQLQSQINPHFLYNSFFIINTMTRTGDYDNLNKFTEQLGRYFQFITRSAADEVTLSKEVEHARVYTEIQAMRYSNRIRVEFEELPDEFSEVIVPRLILQPIIENAFEHGLRMKVTDGILSIRFIKEKNGIYIIVENNGEEINEDKMVILQGKLTNYRDKNVDVTAIQNIHMRLQMKFGQDYGLSIEKVETGGVRVIISIPV